MRRRAWERCWDGIAVFVTMALVISHQRNTPDAAFDAGTVRSAGLEATSLFRGVAPLLSAPFLLIPVGTWAFRAALASAVCAGACAYLVSRLARQTFEAVSDSPRLPAVLSAIAGLFVVVTYPFQLEASRPGGAVLGATLALAPIVLYGRSPSGSSTAPLTAVVFAFAYEPVAGVCALASFAPLAFVHIRRRRWLAFRFKSALAPLALSLAGIALALALSLSEATTYRFSAFASPLGEGQRCARHHALMVLPDHLGVIFLLLATATGVTGFFVSQARGKVGTVLALVTAGAVTTLLGSPCGPERFGVGVLVAMAGSVVLASTAVFAGLLALATSRLPYARASASMICALLAVPPVMEWEKSYATLAAERGLPDEAWAEATWARVPASSTVMVDAPVLENLWAMAEAAAPCCADIVFLPLGHLHSTLALAELRKNPGLAPLWRDVALAGEPDESTLSAMARGGTLFLAFEPSWGSAIARHLLPYSLLDIYAGEPRGNSERERAQKLVTARLSPEALSVLGSRQLHRSGTASLLSARAYGYALNQQKDLLLRVADQWFSVDPVEPRVALLRELSATKGSLRPEALAPLVRGESK